MQYEMFYGGASYVNHAHMFRTFDWRQAQRLLDDALAPHAPREATRAELVFQNFRSRTVPARMSYGDTILFSGEAAMGPTKITIDRSADRMRVDLVSEVWVPDEELGNGDPRRLSLHLETVTFS